MGILQRRTRNLRHLATEEFLERIMDERDRLYEARFRAAEVAVQAAFEAQKEAIIKAEHAQRDYNVVHNDLTRKMDAQYKEMIPRAEAAAAERSMDDKLLVMQANYDKRIDALVKETNDLRGTLNMMLGKSAGIGAFGASVLAGASVLLSLGSIAVAIILHGIK